MAFIQSVYDWLGRLVSSSQLTTVQTEEMQIKTHFCALAINIAFGYIANTLGLCEFRVYEDGKEVKNELYYALNVNPNPNQNAQNWRRELITELFTNPEGALVFQQPRGSRNFYVAESYSVDRKAFNEDIFSNVTIRGQTHNKKLPARDVFNFQITQAHSVRQLITDVMDNYSVALSSAFSAYKQKNGQKYVYETSSAASGTGEQKEKYDAALAAQMKSFIENPNSVFSMPKGNKLSSISMTTDVTTEDIIALQKNAFELTAQAVHIPLKMLYGDLNGIDQLTNLYLLTCINPLLALLSSEMTRKIYPYYDWRKGNYIKVDSSCIRPVDILEVADNISKVIGSGAYNVDDIRRRCGDTPLNTPFSQEYWMTKNYAPADEVLAGLQDEGGTKNE